MRTSSGCVVISWIVLLAGPAAMAQAPPEARILRGPYLQALLDTSVIVVWKTDLPCVGKVVFGVSEGEEREEKEAGPLTDHRIRLSGLSPGMFHRYRVQDGDRPLHEGFRNFRAAPRPGQGSIRVAALGDSGNASEEQLAVAAIVNEMQPDLFLHLGDLDYTGREFPDHTVFKPYSVVLARAGFYPAKGNHDTRIAWREIFIPPEENPEGTGTYYSFDWGDAHFACLDTELFMDGLSPQLAWLERDLAAARPRVSWIIVFLHKPLYTVGAYAGSYDSLLRLDLVEPILDRFEVELVISGHDHNYQRSHPVRAGVVRDAWQDPDFLVSPRGTVHLVTGGGGQALYAEEVVSDHRFTGMFVEAHHAVELEISRDGIIGKAISPFPARSVIDQFTIVKTGARPLLRFIRGDVDLTGKLNINDAVVLLAHLFQGGAIPCPAAADVDGSGLPLHITDPINMLSFLFLGGDEPAAPYPACGAAPAADDAWCTQSCK